jgi:hypothetical protein
MTTGKPQDAGKPMPSAVTTLVATPIQNIRPNKKSLGKRYGTMLANRRAALPIVGAPTLYTIVSIDKPWMQSDTSESTDDEGAKTQNSKIRPRKDSGRHKARFWQNYAQRPDAAKGRRI